MKKIGLICEYNPLHNGHVYHYEKARELSGADYVILSMSSYFTQRGDLTILDKFTRANLALKMGVDLVIECPTILSMTEASTFAYAHVKNLALLHVDEIWIGSENDDSSIYDKYLALTKTSKFEQALKENLAKGFSYKIAFSKSLLNFGLSPLPSNDLLGLFYLQAINTIAPSIKLKTIKRTNSFEDNLLNNNSIQSAKAIRENLSLASNYVPQYVLDVLSNTFNEQQLVPFIKYEIKRLDAKRLKELPESQEGIENRLDIINGKTFDEILDSLATKRYSKTKLKRLLIDILIGFKKSDIKEAKDLVYLRILGFNNRGKEILNCYKKEIDIYTNIKNGINKSLDLEIKIAKILDSIYDTNLLKKELSSPIVYDNEKM